MPDVGTYFDGPYAGNPANATADNIVCSWLPPSTRRFDVDFATATLDTESIRALRLYYEIDRGRSVRNALDNCWHLVYSLTPDSRREMDEELDRVETRDLDYVLRRSRLPPYETQRAWQRRIQRTAEEIAQPRAYVITREINSSSPFVVPAGWNITSNERGEVVAIPGAPQEAPVPTQEPESRPPRSVDAIMAEFADRNIHVRHYLGQQRIELREGLTNRGAFSDHREVEGAICELMAVTPAEYEAFRQHVSNLLAGWARSIPAPERSAASPGSEVLLRGQRGRTTRSR